MGKYLNPGNEAFKKVIRSNYVDKTGLIGIINNTIGTTENLTCVSRPRRFGKSYAAQMLCAYYDCTCDSKDLFNDYEIAKESGYDEYLNNYNVIYLDITGFISELKRKKKNLNYVTDDIVDGIRTDICEAYPDLSGQEDILDCFLQIKKKTGREFVFIIDEWDAIIREASDNTETQVAYLNFLRGLFKNGNFTPYVVAAAYMTGILPIKKDGTESAISDFNEYTILNPGIFAPFTGFTEKEVRKLCGFDNAKFQTMKEWYDGYSFAGAESIYNPYSVMSAIRMNSFESYWQKTSAAEALPTYVGMNYDGLQDDVVRLITGESLEVDVDSFENDVKSFKNKDNVLALLIHLGYLVYNNEDKIARIPNKEVQLEFKKIISNASTPKIAELVQKSSKLLSDTLEGNEAEVVKAVEKLRQSEYAPTFYNDEQALRYIIKFAYIVCVDKYLKIEELPSGMGIADVVFLPKKNTNDPAIVVELKWNKTAEAAIKQIKEKNYPAVLQDYSGEIVLVGINYDEKTKEHTCRIERIRA